MTTINCSYLFISCAASSNEDNMKASQTNDRNYQQSNDNHYTHTAAEAKVNTGVTRSTQRAQTSANPEDPDFGLWTPGSEA